MKKNMRILALLLAMLLTVACLTACGKKENEETAGPSGGEEASGFDYSKGIGDDGYWEGIKASELVTLPDYKHLTVSQSELTAAQEEIEAEAEYLMSGFEYDAEVTGAVELGDTVNINYAGKTDGEAFDGGTGNNPSLELGSGAFIPGFEEALVGHEVGTTFDIDVTFHETYAEDLAGKDAVFTIELLSATRPTIPELTDAFVQENLSASGSQTVEDIYALLKEGIEASKLQNYVRDYITQNTTANELPESMIEYQKGANEEYYKTYAAYYGVDMETFLSYVLDVTTVEEMHETFADEYKDQVKQLLALQAVAEKEKIKVTADDVAEYFYNYYGSSDYSGYEDFYGLPYLLSAALSEKAINAVCDMVTIE